MTSPARALSRAAFVTACLLLMPLPAGAAARCARARLPLGQLAFRITPGSPNCGGAGLSPAPAPPFAGEVDDASGRKLADLALGCLYFGGGAARTFPPVGIPDGSTSILDVSGISGTSLTLAGSAGTGPATCTRGAGPDRHCVDGFPGTDGAGACTADTDCGGTPGACALDAHCYFGAPAPVPVAALPSLSVCLMNAIREDACGAANLVTRQTTLSTGLSSRIYLSDAGIASPCPRCVAGTCTGGERAGLACSGGVGTKQTTIECPPAAGNFIGSLDADLAPLSTGTSVAAADATGRFCAGQTTPGAFGLPNAARLRTTGSPLLGQGLTNVFATTLAGTFCVPASGNFVIDFIGDLPGPGAVSVPGVAAVNVPLSVGGLGLGGIRVGG